MKIFFKIGCLLPLFFVSFYLSGQSASAVSKVSITVSDLEEAVKFYTTVLPFEKVGENELKGKAIERLFGISDPGLKINAALLKLGNESIELMQFHAAQAGRSIPHDSHSNDLWFQHIAIVVNDMEKAYKRVAAYKVEHVSTAPQTLPDYIPAAAGISAFYFRDLDDHNLELIYFPEGKGDPRWQNQKDKIFLGIDHTAIGIDETDKSLPFYEELLGLKVAGNSENFGTEQEHLNQVFGARLLITGLRAQDGIGLEFLDYIAPPGGRAYPADSRPNDLWHWHTSINVKDASALYRKAQDLNYDVISSGLVDLRNTGLDAKSGFLVRGPDGHAVFIYD